MFPKLNSPNSYKPASPSSLPPAYPTTYPPSTATQYYTAMPPSAPPTPTMYPHNNIRDHYSTEPQPYAPSRTSTYPDNVPNDFSELRPPPQQMPPPAMGIPAGYDKQNPPRPSSSPLQLTSQKAKIPWTTGLCGCFDDVGNCCTTMFCPCVTFGRIAEIVDRGSSSCAGRAALYTGIMCLTGCACLYSGCYRTKLRRQYALPGGSCSDCLTHCFCECCALCQEYRELKYRGIDMLIGWNANVDRQGQGVTVPPAVGGGMIR